ncbi:MAG: hypothetical protein OEU26_37585, partial [Candidatus Tectomicrobia bacterium]|nr:hypothetical protein [Candidatus Tectomicrobia bacterium]
MAIPTRKGFKRGQKIGWALAPKSRTVTAGRDNGRSFQRQSGAESHGYQLSRQYPCHKPSATDEAVRMPDAGQTDLIVSQFK